MSKQRSPKNKKRKPSRDKTSRDEKSSEKSEGVMPSAHSIRETIESIVVAFVLAFLFRTFEAEAFVIPTGSMAHTLQGAHKDVECPQCGIGYQVSASDEFPSPKRIESWVTAGTCPNCGFTMPMRDSMMQPLETTYSGDRILVNKFAYELNDPQRWDVVVFKFPEGAATNYIKRLIGLPNETVRIHKGDIFILKEGEQSFNIATKPPSKLSRMLQLVHDSKHIPQVVIDSGWPARWQVWPKSAAGQSDGWITDDGGRTFSFGGGQGTIRYRHIVPEWDDWQEIMAQTPNFDSSLTNTLDDERSTGQWKLGRLITDFYCYNAGASVPKDNSIGWEFDRRNEPDDSKLGMHWVGDLSVSCDVEVTSEQGHITLDLIEAGRLHRCTIDVADGSATLSITNLNPANPPVQFNTEGDASPVNPQQVTPVKGQGSFVLQFANVDDQLTLWVDGRPIEFSTSTKYQSPLSEQPFWSPDEPGDLSPVAVGGNGVVMKVNRLKVSRDVYYVATSHAGHGHRDDYDRVTGDLVELFSRDHERWADDPIWDSRRVVHFPLGEDELFPLGDNSPASADGRLWKQKHQFFERDLLIGKAVFIYWPHGWNLPFTNLPFWPNWRKMQFVR